MWRQDTAAQVNQLSPLGSQDEAQQLPTVVIVDTASRYYVSEIVCGTFIDFGMELMCCPNRVDILEHAVDNLQEVLSKHDIFVLSIDLFRLFHIFAIFLCSLNERQIASVWSHLSLL